MKDKIEVLDRYFNSFINQDNDYEFFLGLYDYLKYLDSVPEIEKVASKLPSIRQEKEAELKVLEKEVIDDLIALKIVLKKIMDESDLSPLNPLKTNQTEPQGKHSEKYLTTQDEIEKEFEEFDGYIDGKIIGSAPLSGSLAGKLNTIMNYLKETKARPKVIKYIEFDPKRAGIIIKYNLSKKFDEYDWKRELHEQKIKTELWGGFNDLSLIYFVMTSAKEQYKKLMSEAGVGTERDMKKWWEAFNLAPLIGEWNEVREQRGGTRHYRIYFDKSKLRITTKRLHNYLVEGCLVRTEPTPNQALGSITDAVIVPQESKFNPVLGIMKHRNAHYGFLQLFPRTKKIPLGKLNTRRYRLIKSLFSPENRESNVGYSPVFQVIDRIYENISLPKDKVNGSISNYPQLGKQTIIENTIKELQKIKELQGYIQFEWTIDKLKLKMNLHQKEG